MTFKKRQSSESSAALLTDSFLDASGSGARYVLVEDCPGQSGLFLLREKMRRAVKRRRRVVLVSFAHDPARLVQNLDTSLVTALDFSLGSSRSLANDISEEAASGVAKALEGLSGPCTVIVDSITVLADHTTPRKVHLLLRRLIGFLRDEDELVILHSPHLTASRSPQHLDLSSLLRSSTLSLSLLILRLHPLSLVEHVLSAYSLQPPEPSTSDLPGTDYDLRLWTILHELESSGPANPHHDLLDDEQSLCPVAEGFSDARIGRCVVEWTARNVSGAMGRASAALGPKKAPSTTRGAAASSAVDGSLVKGFEGLRRVVEDGLPAVAVVGLDQVTELPRRRVAEAVQAPAAAADGVLGLTFNLSLTDRQRADREAVDLPYLPERGEDGIARQAPGAMYDGSFGTENRGGTILYQPDSGDDFDDEEDED